MTNNPNLIAEYVYRVAQKSSHYQMIKNSY